MKLKDGFYQKWNPENSFKSLCGFWTKSTHSFSVEHGFYRSRSISIAAANTEVSSSSSSNTYYAGCFSDHNAAALRRWPRRKTTAFSFFSSTKRAMEATTRTKTVLASVSSSFTDNSVVGAIDNSKNEKGYQTINVAEDINGKEIAATIRHEIKEAVEEIKRKQIDITNKNKNNDCNISNDKDDLQLQEAVVPGLAVVLVGNRPDSQTYVNMKKKACKEVGFVSVGYNYNDTVSEQVLLDQIQELNNDQRIHGILVQLPLPKHIHEQTVLNAINPQKDVDGLHPWNVAQLSIMKSSSSSSSNNQNYYESLNFSIPCTPLGCIELLDRSNVTIPGKNAVVLGRSNLVGLPMSKLLLDRDATVTVVHSKTQNISQIVQQADIVIAAIGQPKFVRKEWLKAESVVIDVGINSVDIVPKKPGGRPYKLVGDVDYDNAKHVSSKISPVPGGVGPMTIAMLLRNTLYAYQRSILK